MSGSFGSNKGTQDSRSQSTSESFLAPFQVPLLSALQNQTLGLAQRQVGQIGPQARQLGGQLSAAGGQFLGGLQGAAQGRLGPGVGQAIGGLLNLGGSDIGQQLQAMLGQGIGGQGALDALAGGSGADLASTGAQLGGQLAGTQQLQGIGGAAEQLLGQNPGLQGQISALDAAIQENLRSTAGTIAGQATLGGSTGGSRQALATGIAGAESARQFGQGASSLVSQDFAARQALAPGILQAQLGAAQSLQGGDLAQRQQQLGLLGLQDQSALANQQGQLQALGQQQQAQQFNTASFSDLLGLQTGATGQAGQLGLGAGAQRSAAGEAGLGQLQNLFNLGLGAFGAEFSPLLAAASIINPILLSSGQSSSRARGRTFGFDTSAAVAPTGG